MKSHYKAVVIGGGITGAAIVYHLARAGWSDVALIEPVWCGERIVGAVTSGSYGHTTGTSLALAYVAHDEIASESAFNIEIIGQRCPARLPRCTAA